MKAVDTPNTNDDKGWKTVELKSILNESIKNGAFVKRDQFGTGVSFLNVADIFKSTIADLSRLVRVNLDENEIEKYGLQKGDLIFVRSSLKEAGIGQCCVIDLVEEPAVFDCHLMRVRVRQDEANPAFLAYYFSSPVGKKALLIRSKKTTMTTINQSGLSGVLTPLPPLAEQRRIAAVLTTIQDAIAAQDDVIAAAREFKRSLMQRLFTYGPAAEPAETKETEIGEIPKHWEVDSLGEITEVQSGGTPSRKKPEYYENGMIPWVKTLDLNNSVVMSTEELITEEAFTSIRGKLRPQHTVMIAMYGGAGTIGKSGILGIEATTNQAVCCVLPNPKRFNSFYLHYYAIQLRPKWMSYAIGTRKDPNISKGVIERQMIPLPPIDEQRQIAKLLMSSDEKIAAEEDRKTALQTLFKSMLHQLMTGQIRLLSDERDVG